MRPARKELALFVVLLLTGAGPGCGGGGGGGDDSPDAGPALKSLRCPGAPGCLDSGDGVLSAGAAAEKITPTLVEKEWTDTNMDGDWQPGEPYVDVNMNGKFDAFWIAGFGNGRVATSIHDDIWARAIALRYNQTTIVIVTLDVLGLFKDEMDRIRAELPATLDVDYVIISATHTHETHDTAGAWGATEFDSGIKPEYMAYLRAQTAKAIEAAVAALQPANVTFAQIKVADPDGTTKNWVKDGRDPQIADTTMTVTRFTKAGQPLDQAGSTIATWVMWASHPEYAWSKNHAITSDYPHGIRQTVETLGVPGEGLAALGGICVYSNGPLGALLGPGSPGGGIPVLRENGTRILEDSPERAERGGNLLGRFALKALAPGGGAETLMTAPLLYRTRELFADVQNYTFQSASILKIYVRDQFNYDPTKTIGVGNIPQLKMEVSYLQLGPLGVATLPGELAPEIWTGGYDGALAGGNTFIDPMNPNPPNISLAPKGPYIKDVILARSGVKYAAGLGLGNDWAGYIIPKYDFKLDANNPWWEQAAGDHYEETNSIGPDAEAQLIDPLKMLIAEP